MEQSAETKKTSIISNKVILIAAGIVIAVVIGATAIVVSVLSQKEDTPDGLSLTYASEAQVMLDQAALQAAMDEAMKNAADGNVGLRYKNNAYSENGTDFECYIVNSESNKYDMFLTIFADSELQDQVFLSGLVPPGSGFENITLDHALEPGDHRVYVALTQVDTDEETGEQIIKNQVMHTMDFHVMQ